MVQPGEYVLRMSAPNYTSLVLRVACTTILRRIESYVKAESTRRLGGKSSRGSRLRRISCLIVPYAGIRLAWIPSGHFTMRGPMTEKGAAE